MINFIKKNLLRNFIVGLNNANERETFIKIALGQIEKEKLILDAGCDLNHIKILFSFKIYVSRFLDFTETDLKKSFFSSDEKYGYGKLDYISDIWKIKEKNNHFDAILCTEVFEHIPYPIETVKEFSRLIKRGKLILTAPSNSLRHFDPTFSILALAIIGLKKY